MFTCKMEVLVGGHSFVRRAHWDSRVREFDFNLPDIELHFLGKGGATISGGKTIDSEIRQKLAENPGIRVLILELGSNDLDLNRHPHVDVYEKARHLVGKAESYSRQDLVVVLCLPIPRDEAKFPGSFEVTKHFNETVRSMVKDKVNVHAWLHKGLFKSDSRFLCADGVHLSAQGTVRYWFSIRAAIKTFSQKV